MPTGAEMRRNACGGVTVGQPETRAQFAQAWVGEGGADFLWSSPWQVQVGHRFFRPSPDTASAPCTVASRRSRMAASAPEVRAERRAGRRGANLAMLGEDGLQQRSSLEARPASGLRVEVRGLRVEGHPLGSLTPPLRAGRVHLAGCMGTTRLRPKHSLLGHKENTPQSQR